MGQKINPISFRVSITKPWSSRWFFPGKRDATTFGKSPYAKFLEEDEAIRKIIKQKISAAGVAAVDIERTSTHLRVFIKAARPGFVIGQGGKGIEELTKAISNVLKKIRKSAKPDTKNAVLSVNVEELKRSEVSAVYMAQQMAWSLERRMPFRRTMKKQLELIMQNRDVLGAKILMGGRLDGAEIARRETLRKGPMPLQTLRADIDYGTATSHTTYGAIGIKVWIYKGQVFKKPVQKSREERS